ncbi:MAG: acyl-CoA mutase large subunit family protein [Bacteroidales bacterium]|jgi:methylmalonyl-CoA mutase|nr:acyl-CoA mutase large subunit family protein [Bacteroidales bacterium]MBR4646514.1 acyl-CoA mutase large subunit family protein [Bacteroidales bacterium]
MASEKLFNEFAPIPTEKWEEIINKDLKGADYEKKLVWRTNEGFKVRPYYRAENLDDLNYLDVMPAEFPYTRGTKADSNDWEIVQNVTETEPAKANEVALASIKGGATMISFTMQGVKTAQDLATLLAGLDLTKVGVQFTRPQGRAVQLTKDFIAYLEANHIDKAAVKGGIAYDGISCCLRHGKFPTSEKAAMDTAIELVNLTADMPNFKVVNVRGIQMHNGGATIVQELGYTLGIANEYLAYATSNGLTVEQMAKKMEVTLSIASNYFMEIAKLRAFRLLWATMVSQYQPKCDCACKVRINSVASSWNKTLYDPYVNMLRTTTEGMAASLGGADTIALQPFDVAFKHDDDFSRRISRNVQIILKEESYFNKVVDPAAGSYYIENLTDSLAEHAWKQFQEVEAQGGIIKLILSGEVKKAIEESCNKRNMDIATRKYILLGTNQYPNINETMLDKVEEQPEEKVEGLQPYRGAMAFEQLRLATERHAKQSGRPKVFLLKIGNLAMRQARAGFTSNFFGCAGYEIIENAGFATVEEGIEAAKAVKADIVVVCSSDEEYATFGVEAAKAAKAAGFIFIVAGNPTESIDALKEAGADDFIHVRTNVLECLKKYNDILCR